MSNDGLPTQLLRNRYSTALIEVYYQGAILKNTNCTRCWNVQLLEQQFAGMENCMIGISRFKYLCTI